MLVSSDFNESNFNSNLFNGNSSMPSNLTGNASFLNTSNSSSYNLTVDLPRMLIPFIPSPLTRVLSVNPILCVIGFDFNCFNDTNVTRLRDTAFPVSDAPLPVGFVALGIGSVAVVGIVLGIYLNHKFKQKPVAAPAPKKTVIPIRIDWPPNKKQALGNGMHPPVPQHPFVYA